MHRRSRERARSAARRVHGIFRRALAVEAGTGSDRAWRVGRRDRREGRPIAEGARSVAARTGDVRNSRFRRRWCVNGVQHPRIPEAPIIPRRIIRLPAIRHRIIRRRPIPLRAAEEGIRPVVEAGMLRVVVDAGRSQVFGWIS